MTPSSEENEFLRVALAAIPRIVQAHWKWRSGATCRRPRNSAVQRPIPSVQWTQLCVSFRHKWSNKRFRKAN
jgi:hypothetical protein